MPTLVGGVAMSAQVYKVNSEDGPFVRLEGFGNGFQGANKFVKLLRETKTMIIVEWGAGSRRFSKKHGHEVGNSDIWSGWRISEQEGLALQITPDETDIGNTN